MLALEFPGCDRLLAMIDAAVSGDCERRTTDCLRNGLSALIRSQEVRLPDCVFEPVADHYARRELYRCERAGYSVVAMTWGPGQGTPIHDHAGLWCVEGVWTGQLEITQYEVRERDGERFRFEAVGTTLAGVGSAGSLIPPHEYHAIRNPSDAAIAVSLHIYKQALTCCATFQPQDDGWHTRCARQLGLDEAA
ncbi:cysteine dioxygenase family protein [Arenimonas fontis]|uniref:Cysteine dioxygenase n=1 Tax=Arenimonas fontis TaxID=2608255 RepID=A0A5B2ZGG5_9GAMM|nr:cysteine dioxygenase family protein [Arenimonas fontis]KAA2286161.1 cysteine dioxygenase [Arenimonas fontis]